MNETQLSKAVREKLIKEGLDLTAKQYDSIFDTYQEIAQGLLAQGEKVSMHGFGKLERKIVKGRSGVSFGKPYKTEDSYSVKFTPFKKTKDALN